jgi:hypothetical protein
MRQRHQHPMNEANRGATGLGSEFSDETAAINGVIFDQVLPGIDGWNEIEGHPSVWHVRFMQVPGLAEEFVADRRAQYLGYFLNFGKFTTSEVHEALTAYATPAQLHAVFEIYRAFPANGEFNAAQSEPLAAPVFLAAGEGSPFAKLLPLIASHSRADSSPAGRLCGVAQIAPEKEHILARPAYPRPFLESVH